MQYKIGSLVQSVEFDQVDEGQVFVNQNEEIYILAAYETCETSDGFPSGIHLLKFSPNGFIPTYFQYNELKDWRVRFLEILDISMDYPEEYKYL